MSLHCAAERHLSTCAASGMLMEHGQPFHRPQTSQLDTTPRPWCAVIRPKHIVNSCTGLAEDPSDKLGMPHSGVCYLCVKAALAPGSVHRPGRTGPNLRITVLTVLSPDDVHRFIPKGNASLLLLESVVGPAFACKCVSFNFGGAWCQNTAGCTC